MRNELILAWEKKKTKIKFVTYFHSIMTFKDFLLEDKPIIFVFFNQIEKINFLKTK